MIHPSLFDDVNPADDLSGMVHAGDPHTAVDAAAADEVTDYDITTAMHHLGGTFVAKLAAAWLVADAQNRARIKAAFPDYWEDYRDVVIMRRRQGKP